MDVKAGLLKTDLQNNNDEDINKDGIESPAYPRAEETCLTQVIRAAVHQEDELCGYLRHVLIFCKHSSLSNVSRTLVFLTAVAIFIIGLVRFRECHVEQEIPLFLVLEGAVLIFKTCVHVMSACQRRVPEEGERNTLDTLSDIATVFIVLWSLTGSVWVFGTYGHVNLDDPEVFQYCDRLVYFTAFWYLFTFYTCVIVMILVIAVLCCYYWIKSDGTRKQLPYSIQN